MSGLPESDFGRPRRARRLAVTIQRVLAAEISELSDPALEGVSVTGVDVGVDLDLATVHFYCMGTTPRLEEAQAALERATPRLRRALSAALRTKKVPRLRFKVDSGIKRGLEVERRLSEISGGGASGDS